ncbi:MAG: hypothetical protein U5R48_13775 [Gammaproteobacteria bacterium]|nr:hypothetical protein [Gammaproteobacteria bacterium]
MTYDWRRDLQQTAADLDRFIEGIRAARGDPDLRVDVVAHSMGGADAALLPALWRRRTYSTTTRCSPP